jgi:dipeptidyl aminopeptidase/acylaminoacyl peptidase
MSVQASPRRVAAYGSWPSKVGAERVAGASLRLGQVVLSGGDICWTEGRPHEAGRNVLVRVSAGGIVRDLTPPPWNVRSRVHEYGGGAFTIGADAIWFCQYDDQRLYRLDASGGATALTRDGAMRYADALLDASRRRLIAVREDHGGRLGEPVNTLVAIDVDSGDERVLAEGHDFYSSPCLRPDGRQLAWLTWDHPNMPWDGTDLWVAAIEPDGTLGTPRHVAGGRAESIFQPAWSPGGVLHFVSDRTGWWNLYREHADAVEALCPIEAEFGEPQWVFGMSTYGFDGAGRIVCTYHDRGRSRLAWIDAHDSTLHEIETPFEAIRDIRVGSDFAAFFGGSPTAPEALVRLDLRTGAHALIRTSSDIAAAVADTAHAEPIAFASAGGRTAHAYFYAPTNAEFEGPPDERPPLLVIDHGGPTGATGSTLRWGIQYWTQRGFAVVDVDYGGSTGYGRAYRELLRGAWGVVDVEDSIHAARHLIERGAVDPKRVAIRGASAGGYTTLAALTFHDFFVAGASHYGIGDLEALARDTHKFESRYLDSLVGPYPEAAALYRARSPIHHIDRLSSALILFQGDEDRVVPKAQSEAMAAAVQARGLPVAYLLFAHEQHGFRRAENICRALEAELYFYGKVLGFEPADRIEPVAIENLPADRPGSAANEPPRA